MRERVGSFLLESSSNANETNRAFTGKIENEMGKEKGETNTSRRRSNERISFDYF